MPSDPTGPPAEDAATEVFEAESASDAASGEEHAALIQPGALVDQFEILQQIGAGGMGVVYLARDTVLDRRVAIKVLRSRAIGSDESVQRFLYEARATAKFSHPNIVTIHHVGETGGEPYVALEHLDGRTLRSHLADGPLPTEEALRIGRAVTSALCEAHRHRILHRDLKPDNVMLLHDGSIKVLDFGLAKMVEDVAVAHDGTTVFLDDADTGAATVEYTHSRRRRIQGTPAYMAPEQWQGEPPTGAADVWALGLLLRELVTGEHPYRGLTLIQICALVASSAPVPAPDPALPTDLREVLAACLSKIADDRPTAVEVLESLRRGVAAPSAAAAAVPAAKPRPRSWVVWIAAALAAIATSVIFVPTWFEQPVTDQPPLSQVLEQPFFDFVMEPNAEYSERTALRHPEAWDDVLFHEVQTQIEIDLSSTEFFQRLDEVWDEWSVVLAAVREKRMPEVIAAIPYQETRYSREAQSPFCAKGYWQLMPEVAVRAGLLVRDCSFNDEPGTLWSPTSETPAHAKGQIYQDAQGCRIPARMGCAVDERTDIVTSTAAALVTLDEAWRHREILQTGAAVQLTVAVYTAGLDDRRFGVNSSVNVLPSIERWRIEVPDGDLPGVYGASVACDGGEECDPPLNETVRRYISGVIAAHILAVCYYGSNYATDPVFRPWSKYTDGYCTELEVPSRADLTTEWGEGRR